MVETLKTVLDLVRDPKQNSKLFQSNENAKMILDDIYLKYLTNPAGKIFLRFSIFENFYQKTNYGKNIVFFCKITQTFLSGI